MASYTLLTKAGKKATGYNKNIKHGQSETDLTAANANSGFQLLSSTKSDISLTSTPSSQSLKSTKSGISLASSQSTQSIKSAKSGRGKGKGLKATESTVNAFGNVGLSANSSKDGRNKLRNQESWFQTHKALIRKAFDWFLLTMAILFFLWCFLTFFGPIVGLYFFYELILSSEVGN